VPRVCTICSHDERHAIEVDICEGKPNTRIATSYGVKEQAIRYHKKAGHLSERLALAVDAERAAKADTLLDRIEALQRRTEEALTKAEEGENLFATFRGIAEMRRNLELIGEITKELNRQPQLNLHLNPEYIEKRTLLIQALEPYPEAKDAAVRALLESEAREPTNDHH